VWVTREIGEIWLPTQFVSEHKCIAEAELAYWNEHWGPGSEENACHFKIAIESCNDEPEQAYHGYDCDPIEASEDGTVEIELTEWDNYEFTNAQVLANHTKGR
jgi:hypothetical protein